MAYTPAQIQQMIIAAANQYGVPANIALGVASHESGFNPNAINTANSNGTTDYGVMQLNSTTVQTLGIQNPLDPQTNIDAGVSLLGKYIQQYGSVDPALQAYMAGPGSLSSSPSSAVQSFIDYVTGYGGGSASTDTSTSPLDDLSSSLDTLTSETSNALDLNNPWLWAAAVGAVAFIAMEIALER